MLLNHFQNNPLNITRTTKARLINYFWSNHKLHPYNNIFHPKHKSSKPPEFYKLDITQLYKYPHNILNEPLTTHPKLQPGIVAATAPFNSHIDINFKKYCYLLILYNEGTIAIGEKQNPNNYQPQKELDLILLNQHEYHKLELDNRAWNRLKAKKNLEPLDDNLLLGLYINYKDTEVLQQIQENFKEVIKDTLNL